MTDEPKHGMDFMGVVAKCAMNDEFVKGFNRLCNCNLSFKDTRPPIIRMIDEATGYPYPFKIDNQELMKFAAFVWDTVWTRLPEDCFEYEIVEEKPIA